MRNLEAWYERLCSRALQSERDVAAFVKDDAPKTVGSSSTPATDGLCFHLPLWHYSHGGMG